MSHACTLWRTEHFIAGHPALDLCNSVQDRRVPAPDNDLFRSARDIGSWLGASGLADRLQAETVSAMADGDLVVLVRNVRRAALAIFDAIASGREPPALALGSLFLHAGNGIAAGLPGLGSTGTRPDHGRADLQNPGLVAAYFALLAIEAFYILPRQRIHACPRCGWLFVDRSRGGRRRWCAMRICGNREKVSRHRAHTPG